MGAVRFKRIGQSWNPRSDFLDLSDRRFSVLTDQKLKLKESEKQNKYQDIQREIPNKKEKKKKKKIVKRGHEICLQHR